MRHLPDRPDLDHYRREAKSLVRAYEAGDDAARERVREKLGESERFVLTDAQYVLAREHGMGSWAALRRTIEAPREEPRLAFVRAQLNDAQSEWDERGEALLDSGLQFGDGEPLRIALRKRQHRYDLSDNGRAVEKAGRGHGWLELARESVMPMNISRSGVVFVQAVEGRDLALLATRLADASMIVHEALLVELR